MMLQAALQYAALGWHVFPCAVGQKKPATPHGFKDATTDEATIRRWWTTNPRFNIGLATGEISGIVALDIDPRHYGDMVIEAALDEHGPLPDGYYESHTGGGGRHYLFAYDGEASIDLADGLEVKSDGRYIIVPPSIHPNQKSYEWELSSSPLENYET
jgi:hypothetical protein